MVSHSVSYILLAVVGLATAVWGGVVSAKSLPSGEKKKFHISGFIILGVIGLLLTIWVGFEGYQTEKDVIAKQVKADAVQSEIMSLLRELRKPKEQTPAEQLSHSTNTKHSGQIKALGLPSTTQDKEISRRKNVLATLRNEYILSHDGISPALLAGTEQPPSDWLNKRLKEMGEMWIVSNDPRSEARKQMADLLDQGKKLFHEGCDRLNQENGKDTAPILLTSGIFNWAQGVQAEIAIGVPERLPEFEKAVVWTSPDGINRHDVRCADFSLKLATLEAIVNNKPSSLR
jgi:hypothetical protein